MTNQEELNRSMFARLSVVESEQFRHRKDIESFETSVEKLVIKIQAMKDQITGLKSAMWVIAVATSVNTGMKFFPTLLSHWGFSL